MIKIELDPAKEQRLRELAASQGQDTSQLARQVLEDFLEGQAWPEDRDESWADASILLTPEVLPEEKWEEGEAAHGSR